MKRKKRKNPVAKNLNKFNRSSTYPSKTDYTRKEKHLKSFEKE